MSAGRFAGLARCLLAALASSACAHPQVVGAKLAATSSSPGPTAPRTRSSRPANARLTVLVFFAGDCPCQAAHDARLRDLYALYHPRGVDFFAVDSETGATAARDAAEATRRGYLFPILLDPGGALAHGAGAEYATETLVIDRTGAVRYHGGIDSDKHALHDDATPFLRDALDDLLAERPLRRAESKALGCALQTW